MYDFGQEQRPLTPQERWAGGVFLAVLVGLFVAEVVHDYHPVKLSGLLIALFWIPLLALHEAGHAVAAAMLNWHVSRVVIGMGRIIGSFRVGCAAVEIRLFPVEGFVSSAPRDLRRPRLKNACIYFAGPGVELLLAVVILLVIGPDRLLTRTEDYGLIGWQSLAAASAAQGVLNLIPRSLRTPHGDIPNDGLGIIRSFRRPDRYYADMIRHTRHG